MHLQRLLLRHFRLFTQKLLEFEENTTVILAPNASGKTSIIEALSLLAFGDSFRAQQVDDVVQFGVEMAQVAGKLTQENSEELDLEILVTRGVVQGKKVQSRLYSVNGVRRRKQDFIHKLAVVIFHPDDMQLIEGSPSQRRTFLDRVLCAVDPSYAAAHHTYQNTLLRRNRLLDQVRDGDQPRTVLKYWTDALIKHGMVLQERRRSFMQFFPSVVFPMQFQAEYEPSVISEQRMAEYAEKEVAAGYTLIGPHKDDFSLKLIFADGQLHDVRQFASRGQQRMGVLWLKTIELQYMTQRLGQAPVLLLDDIFSELDQEHQEQVLSLLDYGQSIITTLDDEVISQLKLRSHAMHVIEL